MKIKNQMANTLRFSMTNATLAIKLTRLMYNLNHTFKTNQKPILSIKSST